MVDVQVKVLKFTHRRVAKQHHSESRVFLSREPCSLRNPTARTSLGRRNLSARLSGAAAGPGADPWRAADPSHFPFSLCPGHLFLGCCSLPGFPWGCRAGSGNSSTRMGSTSDALLPELTPNPVANAAALPALLQPPRVPCCWGSMCRAPLGALCLILSSLAQPIP